MPGGKRGHKIRAYQRRIDALLEEERESQQPIPPPISEEHAALRQRIEKASQFLLEAEKSDDCDPLTGIIDNPDVRRTAVRLLEMMREERELLSMHGIDWVPYQPG
jgi:hypothetical protein